MSITRCCARVGALALALSACSDPPSPDAITGPELARVGGGSASSLPLYGNGSLLGAAPHAPCRTPTHKQFDFWLGAWDVFNAAGALGGTNVVESLLDGCVVHENWTSATGFRGRSINSYDSETGQWHQTWVASQGGHLRMAGGVVQGQMILEGERVSALSGAEIFDRYVWTPVAPDEVTQQGNLSVPAIDLFISFTLTYRPHPGLTPAPEQHTTLCQVGGAAEVTRALDFWVGEWTVRAQDGPVLGQSTVQTDLSDCVFDERFEGVHGYEAMSFVYFDPTERRWYRTFVDSEGERLELGGELTGGALALSGAEGGPGASGRRLDVRATIEADGPDRVLQTWEVSRDGGASWKNDLTLVYERS